MDAWQGGAMEHLAGQIASAKIPLSRMISPQLYWVMSASEFTLDINNPEEPKILCVGNKVAVCLGFQDFSQLVRDYGDKEAKVVINTVGNIFSGQVVGETAKQDR